MTKLTECVDCNYAVGTPVTLISMESNLIGLELDSRRVSGVHVAPGHFIIRIQHVRQQNAYEDLDLDVLHACTYIASYIALRILFIYIHI
jgi:hypothetical protein